MKNTATKQQTPEAYLDYLSEEIEDAKAKAQTWMRQTMISHLMTASRRGYLTTPSLSERRASGIVDRWSEKKEEVSQ